MSKELEMARELVRMLEEKEKLAKVMLSTLKPGQTFLIGNNEFIVLEQSVDGNDVTFVISKGLWAEKMKFGDSQDYKISNLQKVIEYVFLPEIEEEIAPEDIIDSNADLTTVDMQTEFGSCLCKARPLTFDEARKYNDLLVNNDLNDWWWTCTPWSTSGKGCNYTVATVMPHGGFGYCLSDTPYGVRPALYLNSNIFVSLP